MRQFVGGRTMNVADMLFLNHEAIVPYTIAPAEYKRFSYKFIASPIHPSWQLVEITRRILQFDHCPLLCLERIGCHRRRAG